MLPDNHPLYPAEVMLSFIFEKAPPDQYIEFRLIWNPMAKDVSAPTDGNKRVLIEMAPIKDFEKIFDNVLADWIIRNNKKGYDIFYGVCPRRVVKRNRDKAPLGGKNEDISHATCAWMDYDKVTYEAVAQADPKPTVVVKTGHGAHFYYVYKDAPVDIARATKDADFIKVKFGGDHTTDAARILRVPGTKNWKEPEKDLQCEILVFDSEIYFEGIKVAEAATQQREEKKKTVFDLPWDLRNVIVSGYSAAAGEYEARDQETKELDRSAVDFRVMLDLFRFGFSDDQLREIFQNPKYGISEKVREESAKGNAEHYLSHTIDKAKLQFQKQSLQHDEIMGDMVEFETLHELAKAPPLQFAVDNILPIGGMLTISGAAKAGKSLIVTELAILLSGAPGKFIGQFNVNRTGIVAYCQAEVSRSSMDYRLATICDAKKIDAWRDLPIRFLNRSFDLGNPRHVVAVANGVKKIKADFLIVDPLARFHNENENRQKDMASVLRNLEKIGREAGVLGIILIHHFGKPVAGGDEERQGVHMIRGGSVIGDWGNAHMLLQKKFNKQTGNKYATVSFELRDAEEPPPIDLILNKKTLMFGRYSENDDNLPMVRAARQKYGDTEEAAAALAKDMKTTKDKARQMMAQDRQRL